MSLLEETLRNIEPLNKQRSASARKEWDGIAHPTGSLGELEELTIKVAAIQDTNIPDVSKRVHIVMASDNGIIEENVSSGYSDLTSQLVYSMAVGGTAAANMCKETNTKLVVVDLGTRRKVEHENVTHRRINPETKNFAKEPAMTISEAIKAIETGIEITDELVKEGYKIFGTGELGIANTTTSAAVLTGLTGKSAEETCGLGAGITDEGLRNKIRVVDYAMKEYDLENKTPLEILAYVGGYDICGLVGIYLSCAKNKTAAVIDGFISGVAALCAVKMNPAVKDYLLPSHRSRENQIKIVFDELEMNPPLDLKMRLGEGTGCMLLFKVLDTGVYLLKNMARYQEINILENVLVDIREKC
ncbi:MAG: nicotinate-nucleotide--dimethylbenzimidazole phosphoribosyltransferase [Ezakiella sp.]|nr:nicotinate-nucleotide--dimethylbenzimidazole phosphoribosyltransferase [Ezakiella sp.]